MIKISSRICPVDHEIFLTVFPFVKTYTDKFESCAVGVIVIKKSWLKIQELAIKISARKYFTVGFS